MWGRLWTRAAVTGKFCDTDPPITVWGLSPQADRPRRQTRLARATPATPAPATQPGSTPRRVILVTKMLATPREVAEALNLSVHTIHAAIRDGRIPAVRPLGGRTVRVRVEDVMRLVGQPTRS